MRKEAKKLFLLELVKRKYKMYQHNPFRVSTLALKSVQKEELQFWRFPRQLGHVSVICD